MDIAAPSLVTATGRAPRRADPCAFVIFGAAGDLTKRLLLPALYNLAAGQLLPEGFAVVGVARAEMSDDEFRRYLADALKEYACDGVAQETLDDLIARCRYVRGDLDDPSTYGRLKTELAKVNRAYNTGDNCLFYLAVPPDLFAHVARLLGETGLAREENGNWRRLIIEKPFGYDLQSACTLNKELLGAFSEHQIYRIDHYLGKETVQNIMVLRFANGMFEPIWNRDHVDHVQITVAETVSVESRGKFYDSTGALRDMVPNHLFQLLALTAMEPPSRFEADAVRTEKLKAIEAIHPLNKDSAFADIVRGQYTAGSVNDKPVVAYREAPGVAPRSMTETYVAMRLMIDNWRWAGVPFYLRTGKALRARKTEIAIKFRSAPLAIFRDMPVESLAQNLLILRIQPDEGAALHFNAKIPGPEVRIENVRMNFKYADYFDAAPSTGYETLIYDCMVGDSMLFQRAIDIEAGWRVVDPILKAWGAGDGRDLHPYPAGSDGPPEAERLLTRSGQQWRMIS
ncbi:MAG TPA: glucose-6-phosphate dehydrogenase [Xanthobacteraceae bacterium]|nr:glucose-6-phosphate dehydrogenase [Xanthobacteraceae bacterium]